MNFVVELTKRKEIQENKAEFALAISFFIGIFASLWQAKMPQGTLDVHLMNAKGLKNTEFFGKMDPYVIIQCKNQEKRSKVATCEFSISARNELYLVYAGLIKSDIWNCAAQGSKPVWNEKFVFRVTEGVTELKLTIMDKDTAVRDDFVGELRYVFVKHYIWFDYLNCLLLVQYTDLFWFHGDCSIPLKTLFQEGKIPPMKYNVLRDKKYYGEIKVGLSFTPSVRAYCYFPSSIQYVINFLRKNVEALRLRLLD